MEIDKYEKLRKKYQPIEIPCEICGSNEFDILQYRGRIRAAGEYGAVPISVCKTCGFTFQNPRFEDSFYQDYYSELYREVAFGATRPSKEYVDTQKIRGGNVAAYLQKFFRKPGLMLDHGCASGATMIPFIEFGWSATGIDPHKPSVDLGVKEFGLNIHLAGGEELPFEGSSFDLIVSLGSLEHVFDFRKSMAEARRVLKEDGLLFIRWRSDKLWGSPYEYYNHNHYRFFTPKTWKLALASHGFTIEDVTYDEIEGNTGAAYIIARKSNNELEDVGSLISKGHCEQASATISNLNHYKREYREQCRKFLDFVEAVERDPIQIKLAIDSGSVKQKVLFGDPAWTIPRAILEAEAYESEFCKDPLVNSSVKKRR